MSLQQQIDRDLVGAMKAGKKIRLGTLRMLKAALKNRQIDVQPELEENEVLRVLKSLIKQRRDSAEQYRRAGRKDLAEIEEMEIGVIEQLLPPMLSQEEIERLVEKSIGELGAASLKEMGPVMKAVMEKLATAVVDGKIVTQVVRSKLSPRREN